MLQSCTWDEPRVHINDSTDFQAFKNPQLLIKQAYSAGDKRLRAATVLPDNAEWGVICNQTYLSVRDLSQNGEHINIARLVYNSTIAVYFLGLTGSRFPYYKNEMPVEELMMVPLPSEISTKELEDFYSIDKVVMQAFSLTEAEKITIDDFLQLTLPDALRKTVGLARKPTQRIKSEPALAAYVQTLIRVLKGTFGKDKEVNATIYQEANNEYLPVRMITLHFGWPGRQLLTVEPIAADGLYDLLGAFAHKTLRNAGVNDEGIGIQRVAYLFHSVQTEQGKVRSLSIIKPDERRYWARSIALRDADDLGAAILKAAGWKGVS